MSSSDAAAAFLDGSMEVQDVVGDESGGGESGGEPSVAASLKRGRGFVSGGVEEGAESGVAPEDAAKEATQHIAKSPRVARRSLRT
jgi:hypothetical protein